MSNNKQSSVDWYIIERHNIEIQSRLGEISPIEYDAKLIKIEEQAKAMHKEEIVNTIVDCEKEHIIQAECYPPQFVLTKAEHYYNITFGGNNDIH